MATQPSYRIHSSRVIAYNDYNRLKEVIKEIVTDPTKDFRLDFRTEDNQWYITIHYNMDEYEYLLMRIKNTRPEYVTPLPPLDTVLSLIYPPYVSMMIPITDLETHQKVLTSIKNAYGLIPFINTIRYYLENLELASTIRLPVYKQYKKDIHTLLSSTENREEYNAWLFKNMLKAVPAAKTAAEPAEPVAKPVKTAEPVVKPATEPKTELTDPAADIPNPKYAPEGVSLRRFGFYMRAKGELRRTSLENAVNYYGKPEVLEKLAFLIHIYEKKGYYQTPLIQDYRYIQENL